jgi:hypothetical protein
MYTFLSAYFPATRQFMVESYVFEHRDDTVDDKRMVRVSPYSYGGGGTWDGRENPLTVCEGEGP